MSSRSARRRKARLGTGVLALALLAPAAEPAIAGATDPGEEQESEHEGGGEPGEEGDLTPGQESTGNIVDENSPPLLAPGDTSDPSEGENEDGPVENEAQAPQQQSEGEPAIQPPAPPAQAPAPPPAVTTPPAAQTPPAPAPVTPAPTPRSRVAPVRRQAKPTPKTETRARSRDRRPAPAGAEAIRGRPAPAPAPAPVARQPAARTTAASPAAPVSPPKSSGALTYTVRAGDTLWSIASAQLGRGATAAQIAREVQRLWHMNARAIGTGDPSLLGVGVTLRLR